MLTNLLVQLPLFFAIAYLQLLVSNMGVLRFRWVATAFVSCGLQLFVVLTVWLSRWEQFLGEPFCSSLIVADPKGKHRKHCKCQKQLK